MASYNLGEARGKIVLETDFKGLKEGQQALADTKKSAEGAAMSQEQAWKKTGTAATVGGTIVAAGFAVAVGAAANFEQQLSGIQAVSGATAGEMKLISDAALRIGQDTSFSASEAALAMEELVKAGISVEDTLNGAADATVALAAAGGVDLPTAATIAANAMNQFGLKAEDMDTVVNKIAGSANASAIDVTDLGMAMSQVGAVANLAGLSFEDTSLAIAAMGNAGIKGSDAGTSLKSMLMNLQPTTDKAAKTMMDLGLMTEDGTNKFYDQEGQLKSLTDISALLSDGLDGLSEAQKTAALEAIFGSDAIRAAAIVADTGAAGFDKLATSIDKTSAADVAKTRLDNMAGSTEALMGSLETVAITIGQQLIPTIRAMVDGITEAVNWYGSLDDKTKSIITGAALLSGGLLLAIGTFIKVGQAIAGVRAAYTALGIAQGIANIRTVASNAVTAVGIGILYAQAAAQKAAAAAQWLLNAAMTANPIGIIIAAVAALVAGLVWFFTQTELGQAIWAEFTRFLGEAWNNLVIVAQTVWEAIMVAIGAVVDWFQTYVWPIIQFVIDMIIAYFQMYWTVVSTIWNGVMAVIGAVVDWFMTYVYPVIEAVVNLIIAIFNFLWQAVQLVWQSIWDAIMIIVDGIVSFLTDVWNNFLAGWQIIWDTVSSIITTVWNAIVSVVQPVVQGIVDWIKEKWELLQLGISLVMAQIKQVIDTIWNAIKGVVEPIVKGIVDFITNTWDGIATTVGTIFNNVKKAITDPIEDAMELIGGIKDTIIGFFSGAGDWLFNIGKDIIGGFLDGLQNMLGEVENFFTDITASIPQLKGPPEKDKVLLTPNGKLIMQSLARGLEAEEPKLFKNIKSLNKRIPAEFSNNIENRFSPNGAGGSSSNDEPQIVINLVYNAVPEDGTTNKEHVMSMLGHATELVRKELNGGYSAPRRR